MAGPLRPLWVTRIFSRKEGVLAVLVAAVASAETPARSHQRSRSSGAKVKGTSAGRGSTRGEAKLAGELVPEAGGAHFWNGKAAGGDDERSAGKWAG